MCGRDIKRTLENLQAGDVQLSAEDMAEIAQLLDMYRPLSAQPIDGWPHKVAVTSMKSTLGNARF